MADRLVFFNGFMDGRLKERLDEWVGTYHCRSFVAGDPVQFPHRYTRREDIEISGLLTALLSFGNRKMILRKAGELDALMGHEPLGYVLSLRWRDDFVEGDGSSFYRMLSRSDFHGYFRRLYGVYASGRTLEDALMAYPGIPMQRLCSFMEMSARSPQKKLNMFLRWMVRRGSEVDFGIWRRMSPADLLIPLDTHVCRMAFRLGLTDSRSFSLSNARKITAALAELYPGSGASELHRHVKAAVSVSRHRTEGEMVFVGKGAGEYQRTSRTDYGSGRHIPPVVLLSVYPAPSHVGGQHIGRNTPFPSVAPLDEGGGGKRNRCVHGGERMVVTPVGTLFLYDIFQGIGDTQCGGPCKDTLFQPLPVFVEQDGGQTCHGKQYGSHIARSAYGLAASGYGRFLCLQRYSQ